MEGFDLVMGSRQDHINIYVKCVHLSLQYSMAPVILRTFVHCPGCAGRIRKTIKNYLGTYTTN
jgi:hypothetical protein